MDNNSDGAIVLVDDDSMEYILLKQYLKKSSLTNELIYFQKLPKFFDFLELVKSNNVPYPAVILLDLNMPETTGYEVLKNIRSKTAFKKIPVIIVFSNSSSNADISLALKNGANRYITKPKNMSEYRSFLSNLGKTFKKAS